MRRPPPLPSVPRSRLCPLIWSILIMKRRADRASGTFNLEQLDVVQQLRLPLREASSSPGNFQWKLAEWGFFSKSIFIRSSTDNVKGDFANIFVNTKIQRIFLQSVSSIRNQLAVVFFSLGF